MNRRLIITFDEETSFTDEYGTIEVIYNKSPALALGLRGACVKGMDWEFMLLILLDLC